MEKCENFTTKEEWQNWGVFDGLSEEQSNELFFLFKETNELLKKYNYSPLESHVSTVLYPIITRIYRKCYINPPSWLNLETKKLINVKNIILGVLENISFIDIFEKYFKHIDSEGNFCAIFESNYIIGLEKELDLKNND